VFFKSGKWGVLFVKNWTFPQRRVHYVQYQYFLFYILLIWGVRTHPTHPPLPTGLRMVAWVGSSPDRSGYRRSLHVTVVV